MTEEQKNVIEAVLDPSTDYKIISVNSVAGAGKTSTSVALTEAYNPTSGFYTAFNKAIIEDSNKKLKGNIEAKTLHSLAFKYIKPSKLDELTYDKITENIDYIEKKEVIKHINQFYLSSALTFGEYFNTQQLNGDIENLVVKYANLMYVGKIPSNFNYLLKCLHIMLYEGSVSPYFDLFIFDEFQDVTPVTLEIFKLINARKKVVLGDKFQNIYTFLNTVNGFNVLENTIKFNLTKSFRCNEQVASEVERFGKIYLDKNFIFTGNEELSLKPDGSKVYLSFTNSALIDTIVTLLDRNESFSTLKTINEIFELPLAILNTSDTCYSSKYKFIHNERRQWTANKAKGYKESFFDYLNRLGLDEVDSAIHTIKNLQKRNINIFDLKNKVKNNVIPNKNIVLSTTHAFKGLERSTAYIQGDLTRTLNSPKYEEDQTIRNLYYVALSRAQHKIIKL